jgi:hypothetical protein
MRLAHILQRQRYRLHLRLVALCQAISLEPPYYTKIEFHGHPHHRLSGCVGTKTRDTDRLFLIVYGGGAGSRTPVFPPLLLIVNN